MILVFTITAIYALNVSLPLKIARDALMPIDALNAATSIKMLMVGAITVMLRIVI